MQQFDIAVVGGGILGVAHAYHALEKGLRVAVVEKDPAPSGATVRNFGQIVPSGMDARWQAYGRKSLTIYRQLQSRTDITLRQGGSIYLASDEEEMTLLEELHRINREQDYTSDLLTKVECLDRYPGLHPPYVKGGLYFPDEVTLDPRRAIHRIIALLREDERFSYFPATWVRGIEGTAGHYRLINNRRQAIIAEKVIVCSGSDFQSLFPDVFEDSPLQSVKLQMLLTRPQRIGIRGSVLTGWTIRRYESFRACPSYTGIKAKEDPDAYHRRMGVHILFKQADDGSVIIGDSHEYWDAGEAVDFQIDQPLNDFIVKAARDIYSLDYQICKTWTGVYSQCKDRDVFSHEITPGLHIVTGIGGKGMTGSFGFATESLASILKI
jgi:FAD dependent oxidoreductase TIGR03364